MHYLTVAGIDGVYRFSVSAKGTMADVAGNPGKVRIHVILYAISGDSTIIATGASST